MRTKQPTTEQILRGLFARLANAREMADVAIAAGIALEELDEAK